MKKTLSLILLAISFGSAAQTTSPGNTTVGHIERLTEELDAVLDADQKPIVLAEGFKWTEGPVWVEKLQILLFSDIPQNKIFKWTEKAGLEEYLFPAGYTGTADGGREPGSNGLLLDKKGNLVLCQHGDRQLAQMNAPLDKPEARFVSIASSYQGKKFNSPNDAVQHSNGDFYFTDPPYGLAKKENQELDYQGVYRVGKNGEVTLLIDSINRPNGIALTRDEKHLLVGNSEGERPYLYAYELDNKGNVKSGAIVFDFSAWGGGPDGFKVSKSGLIFSSGPGGIWILNADYKAIGRIRIPHAVSNCALSDDEKTLYITANHQIVSVQLK
jgi:gluconolactonase